MITVLIATSSTQLWSEILDFIRNFYFKIADFLSVLPSWLLPVAVGYVTFSVVYLVIGRG